VKPPETAFSFQPSSLNARHASLAPVIIGKEFAT